MIPVEVGELLIVRFSPLRADALLEQAGISADECESLGLPRVYSISTYGRILNEGETVSDLLTTICVEAPVGGKRVWLATEPTLHEAGFKVSLSEPPLHHYDVELGTELRAVDVESLVAIFEAGREANPAWKKR